MRVLGTLRGWRRRTLVPLGAAAAVVLLTAGNAAAAGDPGAYLQSAGSGTLFSVLRTGNLVQGGADDTLFALSTTGSGLRRLPFPLHLYNQTYRNVVVSSNGNVQFGLTLGQATSAFSNTCLPASTFGHPVVLPYWDDLEFNTADTSHGFPEGIFLRTAGTAPHRTFTVSWQGVELGGNQPEVLVQVVFREGSQNLTYVYGTFGAASATIGIQSKQQLAFTRFTCDPGLPDPVSPTMTLTLQHTNVA
jgi:hypothetical protein